MSDDRLNLAEIRRRALESAERSKAARRRRTKQWLDVGEVVVLVLVIACLILFGILIWVSIFVSPASAATPAHTLPRWASPQMTDVGFELLNRTVTDDSEVYVVGRHCTRVRAWGERWSCDVLVRDGRLWSRYGVIFARGGWSIVASPRVTYGHNPWRERRQPNGGTAAGASR